MKLFSLTAALAMTTMLGGIAPAAAATRDASQERASEKREGDQRPDIVVFLADDLGYQDIASAGDPNARTPNIARLAQQGLTMDRAFVASPACAPSRAALLTGMMPARNGAEANHDRVRDDLRKLPAYLQAQGYEVVAFGKVAHYDQTDRYGFDHFEHDGFKDPEGIPSAIRWLKARKDKRPLALFVGSNWPHVPWTRTTEGFDPAALKLPPKTVDTAETRDARGRYYAAIARLDGEVGATLAAVDEVLGRDTFVLFSSDHGAQWPFAKWNLYDTGTRVPVIVRWDGHVRAGTHSDAMVSWVDILPTLVEVAGGPDPQGIDGRSFADAFEPGGGFTGRNAIFTTHNNDSSINVFPMRSIRTDRWKYIVNLHPEYTYTTHIDQWVDRLDSGPYFPSWRTAAETSADARAIVDAYYRRPAEELYDLSADVDERRNLATDPRHQSVLAELRGRLADWRREQGDDHPVAGTPHFERGPLNGVPEQ